MNRHLVFFIALTAISCQHEKTQYFRYDQWMIPGGYNTIRLKAAPKEVKETMYFGLEDTTVDATGQFSSSDTWRFDEKGNIIYRKNSISDSLWFETTDSCNENGLQSETHDMGGQSGTVEPAIGMSIVTQLLPDGRFKQVFTSGSSGQIVKFISYSHSGEVQTIESRGNDKQPEVTTMHEYKNGRLQRSTSTSRGGDRTETVYFYSKGIPDSVLTSYNGKLNSRAIYINNIHGDPAAAYTLLANGDTVNAASLQYIYDDKGNWTRQLEKVTISTSYRLRDGGKDGRYSLIVRDIKY